MHRLEEQTDQTRVEREVFQRDEWFMSSGGDYGNPVKISADRLRNFESGYKRATQVNQIRPAVEAGAQGLDVTALQNRAGAMEDNFSDDDESDNNNKRRYGQLPGGAS